MSVTSIDQIVNATPAGDKSTEIFTYLLGNFFKDPLGAISGDVGLVGNIFLVFNACVFIVGVVWATYGVVKGVAQTAQSGQFLGQQMSAIWMPIRMVTGIVGVVPAFGGFCLAQVLLISMAGVGIGIANLMWSAAITSADEFSTLSGSAVSATMQLSTDLDQVADDLFLMHYCKTSYNAYVKLLEDNAIVKANSEMTKRPVDMGGLDGWGIEYVSSSVFSYASCGKVVFSKSKSTKSDTGGFSVNSINYDAYQAPSLAAYTTAGQALNTKIEPLAATYFAARKAALAGGTEMPKIPKLQLTTAAAEVRKQLISTLSSEFLKQKEKGGAIGKDVLTGMKEHGWIAAGAWFSTFAEANSAMVTATRSLGYKFTTPLSTDNLDNFFENVRDDLAGVYKKSDNPAGAEATGDETGEAFFSWLAKKFLPAANATGNQSFGQNLVMSAINSAAIGTGGTGLVNPIILAKNLGDSMMNIGQIIISVTFMTEAASDIMPKWITAPSIALKLLAAPILGILKFIGPYLLMVGMFLAIYIPMIPFLVWMGGVVQYAVVVCQGLVGAPIAALSHLETEGEGMGQRSEAGYMFLLNVTFRPALMLFGFFLASGLLIVIGSLLVMLFSSAMANAQGNSVTGVLSFVGFITIFVVAIVTLIQSLFNMIFLLPDQVLGMIGNQGGGAELGKDAEQRFTAIVGGAQRAGTDGFRGAGGTKKPPQQPGAAAKPGAPQPSFSP